MRRDIRRWHLRERGAAGGGVRCLGGDHDENVGPRGVELGVLLVPDAQPLLVHQYQRRSGSLGHLPSQPEKKKCRIGNYILGGGVGSSSLDRSRCNTDGGGKRYVDASSTASNNCASSPLLIAAKGDWPSKHTLHTLQIGPPPTLHKLKKVK